MGVGLRRGVMSAICLLVALQTAVPVFAYTQPGEMVSATAFDTTYNLHALSCQFRWYDVDENGLFGEEDLVYAHFGGSGAVAGLDVRVSATPGTQVKGNDDDAGLPLQAALSVRFMDLDSSGGYTAGDPLFAKVPGSGNNLGAGDLRLTDSGGHPASDRVGFADVDVGQGTLSFAGTCATFDRDGDATYNRNDIVYLDGPVVGIGYASVNDVRLMPFNGKAFGSVVGAADFDTTYKLAALPCGMRWFDDDADGFLDLNDPVYADVTAGGSFVQSLDVRVSVDGQTSGTQVKGTDGDTGLQLQAALALRFSDLDASGGYTSGDTVYVEAPITSAGIVSSGDVRLTAAGGKSATTRVGGGDSDFGQALLNFAGTCAFFDLNGDAGYNRGDIVYLDGPVVDTGYVSVNDVPLMPFIGQAFGSAVVGTDHRARHHLQDTPPCAFRWFDDDGDGTLDLNDPVYAHFGGSNNLQSLDVRIVDGLSSGTQVRGTDGDTGLPLETTPLAVRFTDLDSSGGYTPDDEVYLNAPGTGFQVGAGDVRVTAAAGKSASTRVGVADADVGTPTLPFAGSCASFDANGDAVYNRGDIVYLDGPGGVGDVTVNDVRLMPTLAGGPPVFHPFDVRTGTAAATNPPGTVQPDCAISMSEVFYGVNVYLANPQAMSVDVLFQAINAYLGAPPVGPYHNAVPPFAAYTACP